MKHDLLLALRTQRGLTQEELSERSGISVRTIRNLERGRIQSPRRSSLDLLLSVLDPEPRAPAGCPAAAGAPPAQSAARTAALPPPAGRLHTPPTPWRGPRPPRTTLVGQDAALARLCDLITSSPVTVLTGAGGVGKTRLALAAAERTSRAFPAGVAVAQLGRVPACEGSAPADVAARLEAARRAVDATLGSATQPPSSGPGLLVLDTTEHLPQVTALLVEHLRGAWPDLRLVLTTRRPPVLPEAQLWEAEPLPADSAAELMRRRLASGAGSDGAAASPGALAALCRELDGVPRLIEFAAYRLRSVPPSALMSPENVLELLGFPDFSLLPHQRSLLGSLRWSWDMLGRRHQQLMAALAALPGPVTSDGPELAALAPEFSRTEAIRLLAELADASLLHVRRGARYEYRMLRHVRGFLRTRAPVVPAPLRHRLPARA